MNLAPEPERPEASVTETNVLTKKMEELTQVVLHLANVVQNSNSSNTADSPPPSNACDLKISQTHKKFLFNISMQVVLKTWVVGEFQLNFVEELRNRN